MSSFKRFLASLFLLIFSVTLSFGVEPIYLRSFFKPIINDGRHIPKGWLYIPESDDSVLIKIDMSVSVNKFGAPVPFPVIVLGGDNIWRPLNFNIINPKNHTKPVPAGLYFWKSQEKAIGKLRADGDSLAWGRKVKKVVSIGKKSKKKRTVERFVVEEQIGLKNAPRDHKFFVIDSKKKYYFSKGRNKRIYWDERRYQILKPAWIDGWINYRFVPLKKFVPKVLPVGRVKFSPKEKKNKCFSSSYNQKFNFDNLGKFEIVSIDDLVAAVRNIPPAQGGGELLLYSSKEDVSQLQAKHSIGNIVLDGAGFGVASQKTCLDGGLQAALNNLQRQDKKKLKMKSVYDVFDALWGAYSVQGERATASTLASTVARASIPRKFRELFKETWETDPSERNTFVGIQRDVMPLVNFPPASDRDSWKTTKGRPVLSGQMIKQIFLAAHDLNILHKVSKIGKLLEEKTLLDVVKRELEQSGDFASDNMIDTSRRYLKNTGGIAAFNKVVDKAQAMLNLQIRGAILAAIVNNCRTLVLPALGTNAFKNKIDWFLEALNRSMNLIERYGITVIVHNFSRDSNNRLGKAFKRKFGGERVVFQAQQQQTRKPKKKSTKKAHDRSRRRK